MTGTIVHCIVLTIARLVSNPAAAALCNVRTVIARNIILTNIDRMITNGHEQLLRDGNELPAPIKHGNSLVHKLVDQYQGDAEAHEGGSENDDED
jgi:hypothetical protein